jgi:hypothetical protein
MNVEILHPNAEKGLIFRVLDQWEHEILYIVSENICFGDNINHDRREIIHHKISIRFFFTSKLKVYRDLRSLCYLNN